VEFKIKVGFKIGDKVRYVGITPQLCGLTGKITGKYFDTYCVSCETITTLPTFSRAVGTSRWFKKYDIVIIPPKKQLMFNFMEQNRY